MKFKDFVQKIFRKKPSGTDPRVVEYIVTLTQLQEEVSSLIKLHTEMREADAAFIEELRALSKSR
jgi:hypothetical protein